MLRASDRQPGGDDNHYDDHDHGFVGDDNHYDDPHHGFVGDDNETRPVYGVVVDDGDNRGKLLVKLSQSVTRVLVAVTSISDTGYWGVCNKGTGCWVFAVTSIRVLGTQIR